MEDFTLPVRVYYEDTDMSGVVYHANYLRYFERARTEWVRRLGVHQDRMRLEQGLVFTVAGMEIEFLRPARLDDELAVSVQVAELKRASLSFVQEIRCGAEVLARATVRVACVDSRNFKPRALPEEFKGVTL